MTHTDLHRLFNTKKSEPVIIGRTTLTRDALLAFAQDFDPQAFHLHDDIAQASMLKGLSASGWQSCALQHRIITRALVAQDINATCRQIQELRWQQPLRPGANVLVQATRAQNQLETEGITLQLEFIDEHAGLIMSQTALWMTQPDHIAKSEITEPANDSPTNSITFEDMRLGVPIRLGTRHFSAEATAQFNAEYDALSGKHVSLWHIGSNWMRAMIDHRHGEVARRQLRGEPVPEYGPSPGMQSICWYTPVQPEESLHFYLTPTARRTVSRPGWGLIYTLNQVFNTNGEIVMQFNANIFIKLNTGNKIA